VATRKTTRKAPARKSAAVKVAARKAAVRKSAKSAAAVKQSSVRAAKSASYLRNPRTVIDVDERGRISLAKFGLKSVQVVVDELPGGALSIQPAVVMTQVEAAHYKDRNAVEVLQRGLADLEEGRVTNFKRRSR